MGLKWNARSAVVVALQCGVTLALLAIVEYAVQSGRIGKLYLAAPTAVVSTIIAFFSSGEILEHLSISGLEFLGGFSLSLFFGIGFGLVIALVEPVDLFTRPYITAVMTIPKETLIPLFVICLGVGYVSKLVYLLLFCTFPVLLNTVYGIRDASANHLKVVRSLGASRRDLVLLVLIPSALPSMLASIRVSAAHAIIGVIMVEMLASDRGLGNLLIKSAAAFDTERLFAIVVIVTGIAVTLLSVIEWLETRVLLRWKTV